MRKLFDKLIKQNVMTNKPKIIREKLKDKIINIIIYYNIIFGHFLKQKEKKIKKGIRGKERIK